MEPARCGRRRSIGRARRGAAGPVAGSAARPGRRGGRRGPGCGSAGERAGRADAAGELPAQRVQRRWPAPRRPRERGGHSRVRCPTPRRSAARPGGAPTPIRAHAPCGGGGAAARGGLQRSRSRVTSRHQPQVRATLCGTRAEQARAPFARRRRASTAPAVAVDGGEGRSRGRHPIAMPARSCSHAQRPTPPPPARCSTPPPAWSRRPCSRSGSARRSAPRTRPTRSSRPTRGMRPPSSRR